MDAPKNLTHKPIIAVNDYDLVDGKYANQSDAKALSIGIAQYDYDEISAKVFRNVNGKWSRQSEELPIHRVLDLAIIIVASMTSEKKIVPIVSSLNEVSLNPQDLSKLSDYYKNNKVFLEPRLKELKRQLDTLM